MKRYFRWLLPGLGLKRWISVSSLGILLMGMGISLVVPWSIHSMLGFWLLRYISYSAQIFTWSAWIQAIIATAIGLSLTLYGITRVMRAVLHTLMPPSESVAEAFYQRRYLLKGPRLVAVGGGTGMPMLLRGMKEYTSNVAAIVTVADDGGSSGRLRSEFGILPPGDIRNCLVALADTEPLMERLFQHRFDQGNGLAGHPFGNLFILAMTEATGNFYDAVRASSQVLAIRGRVMPSTLEQVVLKAELVTGEVLVGESLIGKSSVPIRRLFLERMSPDGTAGGPIRPLPDAVEAIEQADVIVLGPGSLYTSIMPNLLVPGIAQAICRSRALKIYVCNIMTEPGETDCYTVSQHIKALVDCAGRGIIDVCLVNNRAISEPLLQKYRQQNASTVIVDAREVHRMGVSLVQADLLDDHYELVRHNPDKLARRIGELFLHRRVNVERNPWDYFLLRQRLQESKREGRG